MFDRRRIAWVEGSPIWVPIVMLKAFCTLNIPLQFSWYLIDDRLELFGVRRKASEGKAND